MQPRSRPRFSTTVKPNTLSAIDQVGVEIAIGKRGPVIDYIVNDWLRFRWPVLRAAAPAVSPDYVESVFSDGAA